MMGGMSTTPTIPAPVATTVEQLSLFESSVPERFRLDEATRRRGMRHIARIKAHLEARYPSTAAPAARPPVPPLRAPLGARAHDHAA